MGNPFADTPMPEGATMGYTPEDGHAGHIYHAWWIKGPRGGVHIWARVARLAGFPNEWIGGVEVHFAAPPDDSGWFKPDQPSQPECWLLEGPCWHDGTSLYFSERLAPSFPFIGEVDPVDGFPIPLIAHTLFDWYEDRFALTPTTGD